MYFRTELQTRDGMKRLNADAHLTLDEPARLTAALFFMKMLSFRCCTWSAAALSELRSDLS